MGKAKTKTEVVEPTQVKADNSEVLSAIGTLTDAVLGLVKKLDTPKTGGIPDGMAIAVKGSGPSATIVNTPAQSTSTQEQFPIPPEYQQLVNTILNNKFKIEISYPSDGVGFNFAILVPREYSNAAAPHWATYGEDRRNKVIQNAFGINGVREYLELIYNNFGLETKAQITADRALL